MPRKSLRGDLTAGWNEVRARTWYWTSLIGHATWNFAAGMLASTGPLIAVTELGGKSVWLAALEASAVGYLAGAFIAGRLRVRRAILVGNIALMSYAAPLILFAVAGPAWAIVVAYGLAMACLGFLNPVWETAVQQEIPAGVLARVSAYDWLVSLGAMPLGYALGPVLAREFGYTWPLTGVAVLPDLACCPGFPAGGAQPPATPRGPRCERSRCPRADRARAGIRHRRVRALPGRQLAAGHRPSRAAPLIRPPVPPA